MSGWRLLATATLAGGLLLLPGCAGPCDALQAVCNYCEDPNHKASCEYSVDRDDSELCDQDVANYCAVCGRRGSTVIEECK